MSDASPMLVAPVGTDVDSPDSKVCITIVVPVRNEAESIRSVLAQLLAQDFDTERFEILVIDGQSTDDTAILVDQIADQHKNVRLLSNPRRWSSAARNIGLRHARGDLIVVVDGHCEIDDDQFLKQLVAAFSESGADCVGRPQPLDVSEANLLQKAVAAARSSRLGHHPDSFIYSDRAQFVPAKSVAVAYRRSVFERVGCFDERFDACEDVELNHRIDLAGLRCYFTPDVAVHYQPRDTLRGLYRQMFRYGRGRIRLLSKHPGTFTIKTLLPPIFLLWCFLGWRLTWLSPWLATVCPASIAAYGATILGASAWIAANRRNLAMFGWLPLVFLAIHVGSGAGMLYEAFVCVVLRRDPRPVSAATTICQEEHRATLSIAEQSCLSSETEP